MSGERAAQRNTFFDNSIARLLLRGGLGTIQQQIGALQKADSLISARLKATKDITRKLNLEDQLLQNAAQIKSLTTRGCTGGATEAPSLSHGEATGEAGADRGADRKAVPPARPPAQPATRSRPASPI